MNSSKTLKIQCFGHSKSLIILIHPTMKKGPQKMIFKITKWLNRRECWFFREGLQFFTWPLLSRTLNFHIYSSHEINSDRTLLFSSNSWNFWSPILTTKPFRAWKGWNSLFILHRMLWWFPLFLNIHVVYTPLHQYSDFFVDKGEKGKNPSVGKESMKRLFTELRGLSSF